MSSIKKRTHATTRAIWTGNPSITFTACGYADPWQDLARTPTSRASRTLTSPLVSLLRVPIPIYRVTIPHHQGGDPTATSGMLASVGRFWVTGDKQTHGNQLCGFGCFAPCARACVVCGPCAVGSSTQSPASRAGILRFAHGPAGKKIDRLEALFCNDLIVPVLPAFTSTGIMVLPATYR